MCVSNNFIEQQAYRISKEIQNNSLYKVVRLENTEGNSLGLQTQEDPWNGKDFITKVILEDKEGNLYSVNTDNNGLRFAKGEITYKEYRKLQRKENLKGYSYFFVTSGFLITVMFTLKWFLT